MYKRKIETLLQEWKKQSKRKPLVIKGVRQCGKTSSVLAFAKEKTDCLARTNAHFLLCYLVWLGF